eukprot:comp21678_c0_seq1/m.30529 comp21678_c0_seq1/g.30529  ORF comp21678_c0_seq1/g.30529 comp21678_c0_seq1/m.30529 type:complete len:428 (-) comp21678_c0_seq1:681-1964(-)
MMDALTLPSLPEDWPAGVPCRVQNPLTVPAKIHLEPVGRWYEAYAARRRRQRTLSQEEQEDSALQPEEVDSGVSSQSDDEDDDITKEQLDPGKWKELDHYRILGLGHLRMKATDEQIKKAFRKRVLQHHPDKKDKLENGEDDDNFFKCVKISYDILSDQTKRRSFDSVDPTFDDDIPDPPNPKKPMAVEEFLSEYGPVFERNARWSETTPVPSLGTAESTQEEVEDFYDFWYNFKSWREFSYLDEEDSEKGECREEKRWLERQNKKRRADRKKDEVARIITLVEYAMKADPRLKMFKEKEKQEKEAKKAAKYAAANAEKIAAEKAKEAEKLAAEKAAAEAKVAAQANKAAKEANKKLVKEQRRALRQNAKDKNYFLAGEMTQAGLERVMWAEGLCEKMSLEEMTSLNADFTEENFYAAVRKFTIYKV